MQAISKLNQKIGDYVSLTYLVVFIVMLYDIMVRYIFNSPTLWGLEFIIMVVGIQYALSGAHAIKTDTHVRIDVVYNLFPLNVKRRLDLLAHILTIAFLLVVVYYGIEQASPAVEMGERSGGGWNSLAPTYMKVAIPVGAALMVLQSFVGLVDTFKEIRNER